jgi:hypothetical protein
MLEFVIGFLGLINLCGKRKDFLFLAIVCKHLVQIAFLHLSSSVILIVTMPKFQEGHPLGNGVHFCWHTRCSMVALASQVDRGIVIQSKNGICDRILDAFYVDNLGSKFFQEQSTAAYSIKG